MGTRKGLVISREKKKSVHKAERVDLTGLSDSLDVGEQEFRGNLEFLACGEEWRVMSSFEIRKTKGDMFGERRQ